MAVHLVLDGRHVELVGDGMDRAVPPSEWERCTRQTRHFGSFGYLTTRGSVLSEEELATASEILVRMYGEEGYDSDEESQS
jgi:hypothetical protein